MKSLTDLLHVLLLEVGSICRVSTTKDFNRVLSRVEHEGLSFLTITLPLFAKGLQKGLEQGKVTPQDFPGFAWRSGLPLFLGGFLERVFDRGTGCVLDDPDKDSILAVRQVTLLFSKMLLPCTSARETAAFSEYVQCEQDVRDNDMSRSSELYEEFRRTVVVAFGDVLSAIDRDIYYGKIVPKHGPGATADKLSGNAKFDQAVWTTRLERIFPFGEYSIPNWRFYYRLQGVDILEPGNERPVRVISVPKTLKTPRIIAIEPTCMQYMQQAVSERLVDLLEKSLLREMIGFTDQSPNQAMAREGSQCGNLATLDLSEASDRVSNQLVRTLSRHFPHLHEGLDATRSRRADVPGHGIIRLAKYASMGSALCFPIEAMVFFTIVLIGIARANNTRVSPDFIRGLVGKVRVYGDDLIVPRDSADSVISALEDFGLRVNRDKSFLNGKFRESCGKEYYDGYDVSVVKCRRLIPTERSSAEDVVSMVSLRNQLYFAGFWQSAKYLDDKISSLLNWYPVVFDTSPVLGRHSFLGFAQERLSRGTHRPLVRGWVPHSVIPRSGISGEGALLKYFLKRGVEPIADREHLLRAGRPKSVSIRLRWANSY